MKYYVRPTMGRWAVFEPVDQYHAEKHFEGTKQQCEQWVQDKEKEEK